MTASELLAELDRRGVEVVAAGDRLRFRPRHVLDDDLLDALRQHKAALLAMLPPPRELSLAERVESGYVNPGWRPLDWAARLRQLAERCEALRPELAATYCQWAANVESAT